MPRITARAANEAWTWDISKLPTRRRGVYLNLYVVLDLYSRFIVAWMVSHKENAALAQYSSRRRWTATAFRMGH
ncbi:DDE-type integrase/transposase/recombinase [Halomonas sp. HK25]|uniref:DDE-type integrase/transposase/recombinase n=1 Tax=Halomonas sp. HK25 TaxID=3394321 RepID=UPI0039FDC456